MTINTIFGTIFKALFVFQDGSIDQIPNGFQVAGVNPTAVQYFIVSMPAVVLFAPVGAFLSSFLHRKMDKERRNNAARRFF